MVRQEAPQRRRHFENPTTDRIAGFLLDVGLMVRPETLEEWTFLPGIKIDHGSLLVDESRLLHPGDLLHEAGHLAVAQPGLRQDISGKIVPDEGQRGGDEMAAIAWSYAAAVHLGLDPSIVFHQGGYKGDSAALLDNFTNGRYIGVPLLQWMDMTADDERARQAGIEPYPKMIAWLRGERKPPLAYGQTVCGT